MKDINQFKAIAFEKFRAKKEKISFNDPISFLYSLDWDVPTGPPFPENKIALMNIHLDEKSCFGRSVKASVLAETFFPETKLYSAEVCEDFFRSMLVHGATNEDWLDETYVAEILQYESPHSIIVSNEQQFDPLFKCISDNPQSLRHPSIFRYDLWQGLHCSYLVSEALLKRDGNPKSCLTQLLIALELYPENILVKENLAGMFCYFEQFDNAIMYAKETAKIRKDAKTLWFLWILTSDKVYKDQIISQYNQSMFNYLNLAL